MERERSSLRAKGGEGGKQGRALLCLFMDLELPSLSLGELCPDKESSDLLLRPA